MRYVHALRAAVRFGLVLTLLVSTQGMLLVHLAFKANERFVAERLCVNRTRPELNCHGRCQLAKMRAAQAERDAKQVAHVETVVGLFAATEVARPAPPHGHAAIVTARALPRPRDWQRGPDGVRNGVFLPPRGI